MARGGYRPGAGRPKGSSSKPAAKSVEIRQNLTPLEYMLAVMNNPKAEPDRRDRMAIAAAPYCHQRAADRQRGKKDLAAEAAQHAGDGSDWGGDLRLN